MLDAQSIDLHYGAAQALRAVSLKAEPGKVTCVLGRNGVGKTSLLDALAGQQPVSRGTITWEGSDITALKPPERARRGIAYVPQGREIFPISAACPTTYSRYSRCSNPCCADAAATFRAASSSSSPLAVRW